MYVFGNSNTQPCTVSGWNTNLRRLMAHAETKEGVQFQRFTLKDMRRAAVTDRVEEGMKTSRTLLGTAAIEWNGKHIIGAIQKLRGQQSNRKKLHLIMLTDSHNGSILNRC